MTERKWTPGPWEVATEVFKTEQSNLVNWHWVGPAYSWETRICRVVEYSNEEEMQKANAHLIAAAPDLYEALESMTVAYEFEYGTDCPQARKARAALAKARGEA